MAAKIKGRAGKLNLEIEQGATFNLTVTWKDETEALIDLTGYDARMHIRDKIDTATTILELTVLNGRIILGGVTGEIAITIASADTEALDFSSAVYDLELISSLGTVTRLLEGRVSLDREVTRQ